MSTVIALASAAITSAIVAVLLIVTRRYHGHLSMDSSSGVQKLHVNPTPRVGGVAVMVGAIVGGMMLDGSAANLWWLIALASLPAFTAGFIEDITKKVGVKIRLGATILSGLAFCLISHAAIDRVDLPGLDQILAWWPAAVLFTAFAIGGIANAVNLIDGVNGLASGTAIIILSGMAVVCLQVGDIALMQICLLAIGATLGFFLTNYPRGWIFLGDAGAYGLGFILAVIAVLLPARNPELSPLIGLLALSYPVIETFVSIHRRLVRADTNPGQPDRLHLHSLVFRNMAVRVARACGMPGMRNAMTSTIMWILPLISSALTVLAARSSIAIWAGLGVMLVVYLLAYRRVALLRGSQSPMAALRS